MEPSPDQAAVLRTMRERSPSLYRKLLKAAKQARGLTPVTTDAGETKRAMRYVASALDGTPVSGKRARKLMKRLAKVGA